MPILLFRKQLLQHDIVQYKGRKRTLDYRANNGKETYWSDAMFGGMPTYQTGAQFRGDVIKKIDDVFNFLPKPANFIFLLFAGFFLLGYVVPKIGNMHFSALLSSDYLLIFILLLQLVIMEKLLHWFTLRHFWQEFYWFIFVKNTFSVLLSLLFMGLQICANHPQMTYYLFLASIFIHSELVRAAKGKTEWKHFFISSGILGLAMILGVGMNSQRLLANSEYVKETVEENKFLNPNIILKMMTE
jgi:hypothetical protein